MVIGMHFVSNGDSRCATVVSRLLLLFLPLPLVYYPSLFILPIVCTTSFIVTHFQHTKHHTNPINPFPCLLIGGQDDNLSSDRTEEDSLFALAEWNAPLKQKKLSRVGDQIARNLLAQMLLKDPLQRPSLARVLAHPFLSGKKVARLVGEKPKYDVFLSYRVARYHSYKSSH